jgi:hypothetical protein|tara:strand:- start:9936 stop:10202 length:267 start_codon:yes stop_codon:yes gene_type:complete
MLNIIVLPIIIGCNDPQNVETAIPLARDSVSESLDRSAESLDNMIYLTEKMTGDLEIMIENQDAIFRAVTNCISDETCEALKQSMVRP